MFRDELFKQTFPQGGFQFNEPVAAVFDDMLVRSVPYYHQVIAMTARLLANELAVGDRVYDLGCSTGTTLIELSRQLKTVDLEFVGIDSSSAMLDRAREKASRCDGRRVRFLEQDILDVEMPGAGAVILNYTLQFIAPETRGPFLRKICQGLRPGGIMVVSEKVTGESKALNSLFTSLYYQFKKEQGYSDLEIAQKREALEDVLIPFSLAKNRELLLAAGFSEVETFFQWFNFASFVAVKR